MRIGAVKVTMVGLLVLHGATAANALTVVLMPRLFTLWLWVALGARRGVRAALACAARVDRWDR